MRKLKCFMAVLMLLVILYIALRVGGFVDTAGKNMKEYCIVIDAGHGGNDPGKVGVNDELEKDINLAIALNLQSVLEECGMKVVLTRTGDMALSEEGVGNKKVSDLKKRMEIVEKSQADLLISIHQNSYSSESVKGAQVFYYSKSEIGKLLAESIQNEIRESIDTENRRAAKANDNYYILLHSVCPAVIVECGFLSNYGEAAKLADKDYQMKMAQTIAEGIKEYLKNCQDGRKA